MTDVERTAAIEKETAEIARLEAIDMKTMTPQEAIWHRTAILDAYWRRRMASRTDAEIARGVIAPGR